MTMDEKEILEKIKAINSDEWSLSLWIVKRKLIGGVASYTVLRADAESNVMSKLFGYFHDQFVKPCLLVHPYDFHTADEDGVLLKIAEEETDFKQISSEIDKGFSVPRVGRGADLLGSHAYVVLFQNGDRRLYAWKGLGQDMQPKKVKSKTSLLFRETKLIDIDDECVFTIYNRYDFFSFDGVIFISNKARFESSMRFREGIRSKAGDFIKNLEQTGFVDNASKISEFCGDNYFHLRKMASISKFGYYKDEKYFHRLVEINESEGWGLRINDEGKIVVEEGSVSVLLKFLNNDRLRSPINNELFDASAKSRVKEG